MVISVYVWTSGVLFLFYNSIRNLHNLFSNICIKFWALLWTSYYNYVQFDSVFVEYIYILLKRCSWESNRCQENYSGYNPKCFYFGESLIEHNWISEYKMDRIVLSLICLLKFFFPIYYYKKFRRVQYIQQLKRDFSKFKFIFIILGK